MGNQKSRNPFLSLKSPQGLQNPGELKTMMAIPVTAEANKIKVVLRLMTFEPIAYISLPIQAQKTNEPAVEVFDAISVILRHSHLGVQLPRRDEVSCRILRIDPNPDPAQNPQDTLYSLPSDSHIEISEDLTLDHNCIYSVLVFPRETKRKYLYQSPETANRQVDHAELVLLPCKWNIQTL